MASTHPVDRPSRSIRPWRPTDLEAIAELYYNTVRHVNARDYSARQIEAWAPEVESIAYWRKRFETREAYVAVEDGEVAGFAELGGHGHVDCLYVHHHRQGRGIGRALLQHLELHARGHSVPQLHTEVSVTAKPFFERMGFQLERERRRRYRGCRFRLFLMFKPLAAAAWH